MSGLMDLAMLAVLAGSFGAVYLLANWCERQLKK